MAILQSLTATQLDKALDAGLSEETPLAQLFNELEDLPKPSMSKREALDRMYSRRRLIGDSAKDFADDLYRLCKAAFPSISPTDCNDVVVYHFIKYIEPSELRRLLLLQPPRDLQNTISRVHHNSTLPHPDLPRSHFFETIKPRTDDETLPVITTGWDPLTDSGTRDAGAITVLATDKSSHVTASGQTHPTNLPDRVNQRTIEFRRPPSTIQADSPTFDEDAVCAAIQATVALPIVHIDTLLPDTANLTENDLETLRALLTEFTEVFAWDDDSQVERHICGTPSTPAVPNRYGSHLGEYRPISRTKSVN
nr:unnamed protein product [Spirometra erinaceieuropaei]